MSDQWKFFPCQMGEHSASIFFDHGISDTIEQGVLRDLLKVRIAFKRPRPDGLPTNDEFQQLTALEGALQAMIERHESIYVGRVTLDGHRHFYIYTSGSSEEAWSARLEALGEVHGYEVSFALAPDASHNGYWQELFPTEDDWQVIKDLRVLPESFA
jgi:hypothetical protein